VFRHSLGADHGVKINLSENSGLLGVPRFVQKTVIGTNITLYDKNKNIVGVTNIIIPSTGLQNIIYNDILYSLIDGMYIESEVYHHTEQLL